MAIRYAVDLTDTERAALGEILSTNKAKRSTIMNAYMLGKADRTCGWTNEDLASAYEVSTKKVEPVKKRCVAEGFEAALSRTPVTHVHRRQITGDEEAQVIALYCRPAPEGHERWTLRLLAENMVELDVVDSVSHETIRRTLKKMPLTPGTSKNGVFHQRTMLPWSAKGKKSEISIQHLMTLSAPTYVSMTCRPS